MQKATTTPFVDEYQNLNSGTRRLNGLKSPSFVVGSKGPSDSGSTCGDRNPMKLLSRKMPRPYVTCGGGRRPRARGRAPRRRRAR